MNTAFVEDTPSINVRGWSLTPPSNSVDAGGVTLPVTWESYSLGLRCWFVCPACERRQLKLYWYQDSWACRKCHRLVYRSQWLSKWQRLKKRESELFHKVTRGRPKGQHRRTYQKLTREFELVNDIGFKAFLAGFHGGKQKVLEGVGLKTIKDTVNHRG